MLGLGGPFRGLHHRAPTLGAGGMGEVWPTIRGCRARDALKIIEVPSLQIAVTKSGSSVKPT